MAYPWRNHIGAALALFLLAACGRGERTTDDPVAQNVASAAAEGTPANVAAAVDCSNRPDFVPIYADALITQCIASEDGIAKGHVSGTIVYETGASAKEVLGWSRAQANASGLRFGRETETLYAAGDEAERSLMIVVDARNGRTRVTVNWGQGT
ncbi:hypothetical protein ACNFJ7_11675 [Sphingomonas sp. HT-1]|uniref:hypothetical protein n=1 Tax=unclassified Sphingomonas TaxID=196159 RepID=UPI0002EA124B|nr:MULTISPECIES: hypothetical protein [unclassified Sphingomonas]KTF70424.1 hypothetical protein ATB93_04075 [Sphingomonas sp. WG]